MNYTKALREFYLHKGDIYHLGVDEKGSVVTRLCSSLDEQLIVVTQKSNIIGQEEIRAKLLDLKVMF